ncbi:MAG TPA: hypothetical protein VEG27_07315 [Usitatibacter sp.]|nr:hypothetical protein [Usitatibacter sp.]
MTRRIPQVGAPDPELDTSPIFDEDEEISFDRELESGACRFNGVTFRVGDYVLSGSELLHCEERGVWIRRGELHEPEDVGT